MLSGMVGICCVAWALQGKTKQVVFLLLTFAVSLAVAVSPFLCVVH